MAERLATHSTLVAHASADYLEESMAASSGAAASGSAVAGGADANVDALDLEHIVGCQWHSKSSRLLLAAGHRSGATYVLDVREDGLKLAYTVPAASAAVAGHTDRVRCFQYGRSSVVTGGEDGRLCLWSMSEGGGEGEGGAAAVDTKKAKRAKDKERARAKPY